MDKPKKSQTQTNCALTNPFHSYLKLLSAVIDEIDLECFSAYVNDWRARVELIGIDSFYYFIFLHINFGLKNYLFLHLKKKEISHQAKNLMSSIVI